MATDRTAAQRQRDYRARQRAGKLCFRGDADPEIFEALCEVGLLPLTGDESERDRAQAMSEFVKLWLQKRLPNPPEI